MFTERALGKQMIPMHPAPTTPFGWLDDVSAA